MKSTSAAGFAKDFPRRGFESVSEPQIYVFLLNSVALFTNAPMLHRRTCKPSLFVIS